MLEASQALGDCSRERIVVQTDEFQAFHLPQIHWNGAFQLIATEIQQRQIGKLCNYRRNDSIQGIAAQIQFCESCEITNLLWNAASYTIAF